MCNLITYIYQAYMRQIAIRNSLCRTSKSDRFWISYIFSSSSSYKRLYSGYITSARSRRADRVRRNPVQKHGLSLASTLFPSSQCFRNLSFLLSSLPDPGFFPYFCAHDFWLITTLGRTSTICCCYWDNKRHKATHKNYEQHNVNMYGCPHAKRPFPSAHYFFTPRGLGVDDDFGFVQLRNKRSIGPGNHWDSDGFCSRVPFLVLQHWDGYLLGFLCYS